MHVQHNVYQAFSSLPRKWKGLGTRLGYNYKSKVGGRWTTPTWISCVSVEREKLQARYGGTIAGGQVSEDGGWYGSSCFDSIAKDTAESVLTSHSGSFPLGAEDIQRRAMHCWFWERSGLVYSMVTMLAHIPYLFLKVMDPICLGMNCCHVSG